MTESDSGLLFEIAPIEDGKKKKPSKRKKSSESAASALPKVDTVDITATYGYLARIDGHYKCDQCGLECLDLIETRKVDGQVMWLITCGWWCMHSWLVEPIPGLLEEQGKKQAEKSSFVVKGGRFDGQTFDEISACGNRWYIEQEAKAGKREFLREAAVEWLAKNA